MKESFVDELTVDPAFSEVMCTSETATAAVQARTGSWSVSEVKNVGNRVHPENEQLKKEQGDNSTKIHHLCWAACIACMTMQKNTKTTYSATDVYYLCRSMSYSDKPSETYPHGSSAWIKFGLKHIASISPKVTTALSSSQVASILAQNKPIYVSLRKGDLGHGMVLFVHAKYSDTSGRYVLMDPSPVDSDGGQVVVTLNKTTMEDGSSLAITSRTSTKYEEWKASYYES